MKGIQVTVLLLTLVIVNSGFTLHDKLKLYSCVSIAKEKIEKNDNLEIDIVTELMSLYRPDAAYDLLVNHLESMLIHNCFKRINIDLMSEIQEKSKKNKKITKGSSVDKLLNMDEIRETFEKNDTVKINRLFEDMIAFEKEVKDEEPQEASFNDPNANLGLMGLQFSEMSDLTKTMAGIIMIVALFCSIGFIAYKVMKKPEKKKKKKKDN